MVKFRQKERFEIGLRVKFKGCNVRLRDFCSAIPDNLIKHGSLGFGDEYFKKGAIITHKYENLWVVEYISDDNRPVTLGYRDDQLEEFTPNETAE